MYVCIHINLFMLQFDSITQSLSFLRYWSVPVFVTKGFNIFYGQWFYICASTYIVSLYTSLIFIFTLIYILHNIYLFCIGIFLTLRQRFHHASTFLIHIVQPYISISLRLIAGKFFITSILSTTLVLSNSSSLYFSLLEFNYGLHTHQTFSPIRNQL